MSLAPQTRCYCGHALPPRSRIFCTSSDRVFRYADCSAASSSSNLESSVASRDRSVGTSTAFGAASPPSCSISTQTHDGGVKPNAPPLTSQSCTLESLPEPAPAAPPAPPAMVREAAAAAPLCVAAAAAAACTVDGAGMVAAATRTGVETGTATGVAVAASAAALATLLVAGVGAGAGDGADPSSSEL